MDWVVEDILPSIRRIGRYDVQSITGNIRETFILTVATLGELKMNMKIKEVMKLQYVDLYKN